MNSDSALEKQRGFIQSLAEGIDSALNPGEGDRVNGFILLTFPFGEVENPRCNHVSNVNREDAIVMVKELLARWQGQPEHSSTVRQQ